VCVCVCVRVCVYVKYSTYENITTKRKHSNVTSLPNILYKITLALTFEKFNPSAQDKAEYTYTQILKKEDLGEDLSSYAPELHRQV